VANNWFRLNDESQVDTPALLLYPSRITENIQTALRIIQDVQRLRPHVKTNKSEEAIRMMIGAGIDKFKCATISEAEVLASCGADDVLIAYELVGPKFLRLVALAAAFPTTSFSCLFDNQHQLEEYQKVLQHKENVSFFLDINNGMNRTGIVVDKAFDLYESALKMPLIDVRGLHVYDGHIRHNDPQERKLACDKAFEPVEQLLLKLQSELNIDPVVIAGGSPTFAIHAARLNVECSPGTFIYWDRGYELTCPDLPFVPAAVIMTRVISCPADGILCTDLGHKSVASENELSKRIEFMNKPSLQVSGHSEEHLILKSAVDSNLQTGDVLYGIPYHVCPTVALYEKAYTVVDGDITGTWTMVARNKKINY
jgi:D-serine deaminase-like pyridoxal phosphate-dependent protein